jgi:Uma2 family endonuclease
MADLTLTRISAMPMQEFIQRSEQDGAFELINGEIVPKMPTVSGHSKYGKRLYLALLPLEQRGLGEVHQEATFTLTDNPDWVRGSRIPDVMFILQSTLVEFRNTVPDADSKPFILVPELVIEIVSPTDNYSDVLKKVRQFLADGVRLVWVIDPQVQEVMVYTQGSKQQITLSGDDTLTADGVLPDFALKIADLFAP